MIPAIKEYPVFEANQVLTATHLNTLKNYLDEQNRLTRAALHGIGIVCGLEVSVLKTGTAPLTLTISKGYGVTSEGYPGIVGNQEFNADRYQEFTVTDGYPLFSQDHKNKYDLWELLDTGHDDYSNGNALTPDLLEGKVVLLFVELQEKNLKNCSATSCDDLGLKVQVNIRKLLVSESELEKLHQQIEENTRNEKAEGDFFPDMTARLGLPDIQLPRLDVPASNMVDGPSVFDAYRNILSRPVNIFSPISKSLFTRIGEVLDACYEAFRTMLPLNRRTFSARLKQIEDIYNSNLADTNIVFSQYFYDFLSDVTEAYEEFRWKAVEFMALCNPPQTLFPRHLELGETGTGNFAGKKVHRHYFRPSPALAEGEKSGEEVEQLFRRLRLLVDQFKAPSLPARGSADTMVRITPSRFGDVTLSEKAIPFYYTFSDELRKAWNFMKTRRGRPDQNLGYNEGGTADALMSDIERYNFFRIEGHLGLDWRDTVKKLLDTIRKYRLPFDVVALNAHPATATADILADPMISRCMSSDLEIIYDAWSKELECLMRDKIGMLTGFRLREAKTITPPASSSASISTGKITRKINVVNAIVTNEGTFGKVFANTLKSSSGSSTLKLKENFRAALLKEVPEISQLSMSDYDLAIGQRLDTLAAMIEFSDALPDAAGDLEYSAIEKKYNNLIGIIDKYRDSLSAYTPAGEKPVLTEDQKEAVLGVLEEVLKNCLMDRLKTLGKELEERNREVDELIFFSKYIQKHPGIAHKAGVTAGGTFILLFQETPTKVIETRTKSDEMQLRKKGAYKIPERVVIGDFFLPYRCCTDCPPVQFVMPAARPIFTMKQECPGEDGFAWVNLDFSYRVPPCEIKIDDRDYLPLVDDRIQMKTGMHLVTVRDAEGGISLVQSIVVHPRFTIVTGEPVFDVESKTATVQLTITNAQLPVTIDGEEAKAIPQTANIHTVIVSYEKTGTIKVGDSSPCPAQEVKLCIPVIFTTRQECADKEGIAWVNLEFASGLSPFEVRIDDLDYVPLVENHIRLKVGTHQITIKDADGCVSHAQSIEVRPAFSIEAQAPVCDEKNENYRVTVLIRDAQLPITLNGKKVIATEKEPNLHTVVAGPFPSGSEVRITVADSSGCPEKELTLSHTCCNLPCKGMALRRAYRFSSPEPSPQLVLDVNFWIEFPAGKKITLSDEVREIILKGSDVAGQINTLIDKKTGVAGWLSLQKARSDNMIPEVNSWWIEYFECLDLKFGFELNWSYRATTRLANTVSVGVNPAGSTIMISSANQLLTNVKIPAFDGLRIDKCHPDSPEVKICKDPDLRLNTSAAIEDNTVVLVADPSGSEQVVDFLWEVPGSIETMANGNKATFTFKVIEDGEKQFRVTAFTRKGCTVTKDGSFKFNVIR